MQLSDCFNLSTVLPLTNTASVKGHIHVVCECMLLRYYCSFSNIKPSQTTLDLHQFLGRGGGESKDLEMVKEIKVRKKRKKENFGKI